MVVVTIRCETPQRSGGVLFLRVVPIANERHELCYVSAICSQHRRLVLGTGFPLSGFPLLDGAEDIRCVAQALDELLLGAVLVETSVAAQPLEPCSRPGAEVVAPLHRVRRAARCDGK